jgi:integrase
LTLEFNNNSLENYKEAVMAKTNCVINGIPYFRKYATINGKRKMIYGKSEKDWQRKVDEEKKLEALGIIQTNSTLEKAMDIWVYDILKNNPQNKPSTFSVYEGVYRVQIKESPLMNMKLLDIKTAHVQNYLNSLDKSVYMIQSIKKVLNMFCRYAVSEGYMLRNPCSNVKLPKSPHVQDIEIFSDEEIKAIRDALVGSRIRFLVELALATGMRQGELLALKHSDFDPIKINVTKTQSTIRHIAKDEEIEYEICDTEPKTKASYREIPLPEYIAAEYDLHKELCRKEKTMLGNGELIENDYMFLSKTGLRAQSAQIQKDWRNILLKAEVDYRSFHSLRHTYITKLVQTPGVNIVTAMELAGHSKLETTLRYTHVETKHKIEAVKNAFGDNNVINFPKGVGK